MSVWLRMFAFIAVPFTLLGCSNDAQTSSQRQVPTSEASRNQAPVESQTESSSHPASVPENEGSLKFVAVYTDKLNGIKWSRALPGTYMNGCWLVNGQYDHSKCPPDDLAVHRRQVRIEDSEAARACDDIGARLPTIEEYYSLIRNFPHESIYLGSDVPRLKPDGRDQMQAIFRDMNYDLTLWPHGRNDFWSSSLSQNFYDEAFYFDGSRGKITNSFSVGWDFAVRCVAH